MKFAIKNKNYPSSFLLKINLRQKEWRWTWVQYKNLILSYKLSQSLTKLAYDKPVRETYKKKELLG